MQCDAQPNDALTTEVHYFTCTSGHIALSTKINIVNLIQAITFFVDTVITVT